MQKGLTVAEQSMVDIAYELLKEKGEPMLYADIMEQVASKKGFTQSETEELIAQLYTEVNIDGRFVCVGRNLWGLKSWFPIDQSSDSAVAANVKEDDLAQELDEMDEDLDFEENELLDEDED